MFSGTTNPLWAVRERMDVGNLDLGTELHNLERH